MAENETPSPGGKKIPVWLIAGGGVVVLLLLMQRGGGNGASGGNGGDGAGAYINSLEGTLKGLGENQASGLTGIQKSVSESFDQVSKAQDTGFGTILASLGTMGSDILEAIQGGNLAVMGTVTESQKATSTQLSGLETQLAAIKADIAASVDKPTVITDQAVTDWIKGITNNNSSALPRWVVDFYVLEYDRLPANLTEFNAFLTRYGWRDWARIPRR